MIRAAAEADIPAMLSVYAPYVRETTYTFEYTVPTFEEFTRRFRRITAQFPWLVWEENGTVQGYAYGSAPIERDAYRWCGEVSIYLAAGIHGRGIGRQLYDVLETIMFAQGYEILYAIITTENLPSIAFHTALGYTTTCAMPDCGVKFGRRLGTLWMEKSRKSSVIPVNPPVPWRNIVQNDGINPRCLDDLSLS